MEKEDDVYKTSRRLERQIEVINESTCFSSAQKSIILKYLNQRRAEGIGKVQRLKIAIGITLFGRIFPNIDFDTITQEHILDFLIIMRESYNLSDKTASQRYYVLKHFFFYLINQGMIKTDPFANIKPKFNYQPSYDFCSLPTDEECLKILEACETLDEYCLMSFIIETGIRSAELYNLKIKDCTYHEDFKGFRFRTYAKRITGTVSLIRPENVEAFKRYLLEHPTAEDGESYLFLANRRNRLHYHYMRRLIKKLCEKAEVQKNLSIYSFRHKMGTDIGRLNGSPVLFKQLMRSTRVENYTHLGSNDADNFKRDMFLKQRKKEELTRLKVQLEMIQQKLQDLQDD